MPNRIPAVGAWRPVPGGRSAPRRRRAAGIGTGGRLDLALSGSAPLALLKRLHRAAAAVRAGPVRPGPERAGGAAIAVAAPVTISEARLSAPQLRQALQDVNGNPVTGRADAPRWRLAGSGADGGRIDVAGPVILSPPFTADLAVGLAGPAVPRPKPVRNHDRRPDLRPRPDRDRCRDRRQAEPGTGRDAGALVDDSALWAICRA